MGFRLFSLLAVLAISLAACTTPDDAASVCADGELTHDGGRSMCVTGQGISETRFTCPDALPYAYEARGVQVCASEPLSDEDLGSFLEEQGYEEELPPPTERPPEVEEECSPGQTQRCQCDGGGTGAQSCDGGSFAACECAPEPLTCDNFRPGAREYGSSDEAVVALTSEVYATVQLIGGSADVEWSLISSPETSRGQVQQPPTSEPQIFLDAPGVYTLAATLHEASVSCTREVTVVAEAGPGLVAILTWDSDADLDLHVKRDTGEWNSADDIYFANRAPRWREGNGELVIDDVDGYGPENINLSAITEGAFNVGVYAFRNTADTTATVSLYVDGTLSAEFEQVLAPCEDRLCDFWHAADFDAATGTVTAVEGGVERVESE